MEKHTSENMPSVHHTSVSEKPRDQNGQKLTGYNDEKNDTNAIKKEQVFNANLKIIKEKYECLSNNELHGSPHPGEQKA